jgi:WD40 repeat protein
MTIEEALTILDRVFGLTMLNDTQELVFRYAWENWTYERIADQFGYTTDHIKNVGSQLWIQLSKLLGVRVTKSNVQSVLRRWAQQHPDQTPHPPVPPKLDQDWGEAPDVSYFTGRVAELALLEQWIVGDRALEDRCRLVALLGMGGIGKSSLAATLAHRLVGSVSASDPFEFVIWRSLHHAPPIADLLANLIHFLSSGKETEASLPTDLDSRIQRLIDYLRKHRCLVILDNVESVLPIPTIHCREREGYSELLVRLSDLAHQSCVILTSREKPEAIVWQEGPHLPVRSLQIGGLSQAEGKTLFELKGDFLASEAEWQQLVNHYAGNPLALKMVAAAIQDLFNRNIPEFLSVLGSFVFDDIRDLLNRQFDRLSEAEKEVMYWLAVNREVTSFKELLEDIILPVSRQKLPGTLRSLKHRFLIESHATGFTQQPVVMEYVTDRLIEQVSQEITTSPFFTPPSPSSPPPISPFPTPYSLLTTCALIKATAKDYLRETQTRLILAPIAERLRVIWRSPEMLKQNVNELLTHLRSLTHTTPGYGAGNLLNLLCYLKTDLTSLDVSHLPIRQAFLQGVNLHQVNFAHGEFTRTVFAESLGNVWSVAFSPNGQWLVASDSTGEIHLWAIADNQNISTSSKRSFQAHPNWICALAFSPDSRWLASSGFDQVVKIWDVETGTCLKTLAGHTDFVISLAFSPDGFLLASGGTDCTIRLWELQSGQCRHVLQEHLDWVGSVEFSPIQTQPESMLAKLVLASGSDDGTIKLWDVNQGTCLQTFSGHGGNVRAVVFSPNGEQLISGSSDRTLKVWDIFTGQCLKTLSGHTNALRSLALSPDGQTIISASEDHTLKVWNFLTAQCLRTLSDHTANVLSVAFHPDGQTIASGSNDQTVRLWNCYTGQCLKTLRGYTNYVLSVGFSSDGETIASGGSDHCLRLWDRKTGTCLQTLTGHTSGVWALAFHPNNQTLITGSVDQTIRHWDYTTGTCLNILNGHQNWVHTVAISPDGQLLASGSSDHSIRIWDIQTGKCLRILQGHSSHVWSVVFSPLAVSLLASSSDDQTIKLWNPVTGECLQTFQGHSGRVISLAFSPDGKWLASGGQDHRISIWDVQTGKCLRNFVGHQDRINALTYSKTSKSGEYRLISGSADHRINIWDIHSGKCLHSLREHTNRVWAIALSPDHQTLISGSEDSTLRLWEIATGQCLQVFRSPRPYEGMDITNITGLTQAQKANLKMLGAVEM